jgi:hypothetical protein
MGACRATPRNPKHRSPLFDFAFVGLFVGILASLASSVVGLQSTTPDPKLLNTSAPPVSVAEVKLTGGAVVDYFAGGDGSVTPRIQAHLSITRTQLLDSRVS